MSNKYLLGVFGPWLLPGKKGEGGLLVPFTGIISELGQLLSPFIYIDSLSSVLKMCFSFLPTRTRGIFLSPSSLGSGFS